MNDARSANEIEALVLKAARGGGVPLGHAEDLAAASGYLDLDALTVCPCKEGDGALEIPRAIDSVLAGIGPQMVVAQGGVVAAYCAAVTAQTGEPLDWAETPDGIVIERSEKGDLPKPLGRRVIPQALADHLAEMAAKTLVPESEASRQAGAGAGLTDND